MFFVLWGYNASEPRKFKPPHVYIDDRLRLRSTTVFDAVNYPQICPVGTWLAHKINTINNGHGCHHGARVKYNYKRRVSIEGGTSSIERLTKMVLLPKCAQSIPAGSRVLLKEMLFQEIF